MVDDLASLAEASDGTRKVVVCRELTKLHEEIWTGDLSGASAHWSGSIRKGEFTVVLEAAPPRVAEFTLDEAVDEATRRIEAGEKQSTVAKLVAKQMGVDRGALYDRLVSSPEQD